MLSRFPACTLAQSLSTRREIQLVGALHDDLFKRTNVLRELSKVDPRFSDLAKALEEPPHPVTFDALLRGAGWSLLFIELTGRCNENCLHCYARSSPEVTTQLTWDTLELVLADARNLGFTNVQFTGGDPLISPHIERAIERASDLGFPNIEVYTNALSLHEPLLDLFVQKKVSVAISLYSHRSDVHDAVTRTPGSHERTSRAIAAALAHGIPVRIGGVQGVAEGQDEVALRAYIAQLGVMEDRITVDRQRPVGRGTWQEETWLEGTHREDVPKQSHRTKVDSEAGRLCVTYNGDVVPCVFDRASVIGNLDATSLTDLLSREISRRTPVTPLKVAGQPLACVECQFRHRLLHGTLSRV